MNWLIDMNGKYYFLSIISNEYLDPACKKKLQSLLSFLYSNLFPLMAIIGLWLVEFLFT